MKVLVTYAVEAEFGPWRHLRDLEEVKIGGFAVYRTQVGRATVDFLVTGMVRPTRSAPQKPYSRKTIPFVSWRALPEPLKATVKLGDVGGRHESSALVDRAVAAAMCTGTWCGMRRRMERSRNCDPIHNRSRGEDRGRSHAGAPFAEAVDMAKKKKKKKKLSNSFPCRQLLQQTVPSKAFSSAVLTTWSAVSSVATTNRSIRLRIPYQVSCTSLPRGLIHQG